MRKHHDRPDLRSFYEGRPREKENNSLLHGLDLSLLVQITSFSLLIYIAVVYGVSTYPYAITESFEDVH